MKNLILLIWLMQPLNLLAHQDTPIELKKNGTLIGLPDKYGKAKFDQKKFTLTIGNKTISIPDCVKSFFSDFKDYEITFEASWYGQYDSEIPYYIHLDITTKTKNPEECRIFFNLETLEIFRIDKPTFIWLEDGTGEGTFNVQEISNGCRNSINKAIKNK